MEGSHLRLIGPAEPRPARWTALGLAAALCAVAGLATLLHADRARIDFDARDVAEQALQLSLEQGNDAPEIRAALVDLRRTLGRRPLDARTRIAYASLLLALGTNAEHLRLAAFHARRAAELAPVTVPVVRGAALVAAQAGDRDQATNLIRHMFTYDTDSAASLLALVESVVLDLPVESAIPDAADAWLAWARQLRRDGRQSEAVDWIERTCARWPDDLTALEQLATIVAQREDWTALAALFPAAGSLPDTPAAAIPLLLRARLALAQGDAAAARADASKALDLNPSAWSVALGAGEIYDRLGEPGRARELWHTALHGIGATDLENRRGILLRLARLEDRHGRAGTALRLWRSVLELDPQHDEARRRVEDLSGGGPK